MRYLNNQFGKHKTYLKTHLQVIDGNLFEFFCTFLYLYIHTLQIFKHISHSLLKFNSGVKHIMQVKILFPKLNSIDSITLLSFIANISISFYATLYMNLYSLYLYLHYITVKLSSV